MSGNIPAVIIVLAAVGVLSLAVLLTYWLRVRALDDINKVRDAVGTFIIYMGMLVVSKRVRNRWRNVLRTGDPIERVRVPAPEVRKL